MIRCTGGRTNRVEHDVDVRKLDDAQLLGTWP